MKKNFLIDNKVFFISLFVKFLLFDLLWALQTTFTLFSIPDLYINTIAFAFLFSLPIVLTKNKKIHVALMLLLDCILIANLMYNRTYNTIIPFDSYFRIGNLKDFSESVIDQMRWYDIILPLETLFFSILLWKKKNKFDHSLRQYAYATGLAFALSAIIILCRGGFEKAIEKLQTPNSYTCVGPVYTVFGCILYDIIHENEAYTDEKKQMVEAWFKAQPQYKPLGKTIAERRNLIIIYCESLESWCIEKSIEGKEITPNLNQLLREKNTIYAPYVLTQVRGGRSIDAQLMLDAGLLPIQNGSYAFKYPTNHFKTLIKAMKEQRPTKAYLLTVDKPIIWNQKIIGQQFGFDKMYFKKDWKPTETMGPQKNLADGAFVEQVIEKMKHGEIWKNGENAVIQMVTYSGHSPFKLPETMQKMKLKETYPNKMGDYMLTANYTDDALGKFITYLKTRKDFDKTMIVIVGDHEGLAADRQEICSSPKAKNIVSNHEYTPFIVINAPMSLRYEKVMGQIDQYPTLLQLLKLDNYPWKGLGQSILDTTKCPVAVGSKLNVEKSDKTISEPQIQHAIQAFDISNTILKYDLLK